MIHTFTILYLLPRNRDIISSVLSTMGLPPELVDSDFSPIFDPTDTNTKCKICRPKYPGVNRIKLFRSTAFECFTSPIGYKRMTGLDTPSGIKIDGYKGTPLPISYRFSLCLEVNPYKLVNADERHTTNLFVPTTDNNIAFETAFSSMINALFGKIANSFPYFTSFSEWSLRRIDYSFNLFFEDNHILEVFKKLTHKTSRYKRTKEVRIKTEKKYKQSAAEKNKSHKVICYDKKAEINSQNYISSYERNLLKYSANGILRYEVQIGHNGIAGLMKRHDIKSRNAYQFLNLDIAYQEILLKFKDTIGYEDFYDRNEAKRIIRASHNTDNMIEKLINLLQAIAQARGVSIAKKKCKSGSYKIKISHKEITPKTFNNQIKRIQAVGVNPVLIPDCDKVKHLINPVHQIHEAYETYKNG